MTRRLLILDNAVHRDIYAPWDHWVRFVPPGVEAVRAAREDPTPALAGFTHVLITGSESTIIAPEPWVEAQCALVREGADRGVPILGSCHGHQLIALALGGAACVRRSPTPEFGWFELELLADDPLFAGARLPAWSFCAHFDEAWNLPPSFRVLGRSAGCAVQALRFGDRPVYGIQAHPEILPADGEGLLADFAPRFPAMASIPVARPARDSALGSTVLANFLRMG